MVRAAKADATMSNNRMLSFPTIFAFSIGEIEANTKVAHAREPPAKMSMLVTSKLGTMSAHAIP